MINRSLVVGDILFATARDRCSYLGTENRYRPKWLADHPDGWRYVKDLPQEARLPVKTETAVKPAEAGPSGETSSRDVRKDGDGEDDMASLDTLEGDRPPPEPTSQPTPATAIVDKATTKLVLLRRAKPATNEAIEPKAELPPFGSARVKRGHRGGRQLKKQKLPAKISKAD